MKIGFCIGTDAEKVKQLTRHGYDHYEASFAGITQMDEREFAAFRRETEKCGIPGLSSNVMFPKNMALYQGTDANEIRAYITRGMERMASLGARIAVLGSGVSRNVPEGYDRKLAKVQFLDVVRICADEARKRDLTIALEPLSHRETNFIHTLEDGAEICREAGCENVGLVADFFHMYSNGDPFSNLETYGGLLSHLHIARLDPDRVVPCAMDVEAFRPIARILRGIGYTGAMSVEGKIRTDFEEALQNYLPVAEMFRRDFHG